MTYTLLLDNISPKVQVSRHTKNRGYIQKVWLGRRRVF